MCQRRCRDIRLSAGFGEKVLQRAAPENNPGRCYKPRGLGPFTLSYRAANRWVALGSRLFLRLLAGLMMRQRMRGRQRARQSGSPPGWGDRASRRPAKLFEDDERVADQRSRLGSA